MRHGPWTPAWTEALQNESRLQEDTTGWQLAVQKRRKSQGLEWFGASF